MSGESDGLLIVPFALMELAFFGVALIGKGVCAGIRAATNAAQRYEAEKRQKREAIRCSGVRESIGAFREEVASNMEEQTRLNVEASEQMMMEVENSQKRIAQMTENCDPEQFQQYMNQICRSRTELSNSFSEIQRRFNQNYHKKINESMNNVTRNINNQYSANLQELRDLANDMQTKQEKAMKMANDYIEEANMILTSLEEDYDGGKFVGPQMNELKRQYNEAIGQYQLGNYEASLATVKDVSLSAIEEIYKADSMKQEWDNYYKLALTISSDLAAYMQAQAVITEDTKRHVEGKIGRKLEDDVINVKINDYTDKREDGSNVYDYINDKVLEIKVMLESDEANKLSIKELKGYVDLLNTELYPSATKAIYKGILNMSNAFSRQNISEEIIDFFEEHNFSFTGYSYDNERHDGALHIGLENMISGEEIIVTLAPELMRNGDVQTRVEINQLEGEKENENRKAYYRESIEDIVRKEIPGGQIKLECKEETINKLSEKTILRDKVRANR